MKNKFLSTCLGVSAIFLSAAFLIRSISPAQAEALPHPQTFMAEGTNKVGKYQMELSRVAYPDNT